MNEMTPAVWVAIFSILITFSIFLANVIYRVGHLSARVEALESWRLTIRTDMHEISDQLQLISVELKTMHTLIQERTERRNSVRTQGT